MYAMRSMKYSRIFYGSDAPEFAVDFSLSESLSMLKENGVEPKDIDRLFYLNAMEFFDWQDI